MSQALEDYISKLDQITILKDVSAKGSLRWYIKWYEDHFPSARLKYRGAGIFVLLFSLVAAYWLKDKTLLSISFIASVAAFFVALNTFFAWGTAWRVYFYAKVRLEFLLQAYEAKLIEARIQSDEAKALEAVRTGFDELLQKSGDAIAEEAKGYFDSLKFPSFKDIRNN